MTASCTPPVAQLDPTIICQKQVFDRVFVDYFVLGCTRVSWDMDPHFHEPEPWIFQLQVAEADIATADWTNVGGPLTNTFLAIDPTQRYCGKEDTAFYRVLITTGNGVTYASAPIQAAGILDFKNWHFAQEIVRKETIRLKALGVGREGFLLKAKRSGTPCPVCLDPRTGEVTDSNCPVCYGQRWVGGFYDAIPSYFGDIAPPPHYAQRELEQGEGMVNTRIIEGIVLGIPFVAARDVFVDKYSDERFQVHNVKPSTHVKGVAYIVQVELRLIPTDWVIYQFPVPK